MTNLKSLRNKIKYKIANETQTELNRQQRSNQYHMLNLLSKQMKGTYNKSIQIPSYVLSDIRLNPIHKILYGYLVLLSDLDYKFTLLFHELSEALNITEGHLKVLLKDLTDLKYITKISHGIFPFYKLNHFESQIISEYLNQFQVQNIQSINEFKDYLDDGLQVLLLEPLIMKAVKKVIEFYRDAKIFPIIESVLKERSEVYILKNLSLKRFDYLVFKNSKSKRLNIPQRLFDIRLIDNEKCIFLSFNNGIDFVKMDGLFSYAKIKALREKNFYFSKNYNK